MKTGGEIGLSYIQCQAKYGNDKLKEYIYKANEMLFPLNKQYISSQRAGRLFRCLCEIGKEVKDLQVNDKAKIKKNEFLKHLRDRCNKLKNYMDSQDCDDDKEQCQRVLKYTLSNYLSNKGNYDDETVIKLLAKIKSTIADYGTYNGLIKAQSELIEVLSNKYVACYS